MSDFDSMKLFISTLVPSLSGRYLNCNEKLGFHGQYIDDALSLDYHGRLKGILMEHTITVESYSKQYSKTIMVLDLGKYSEYLSEEHGKDKTHYFGLLESASSNLGAISSDELGDNEGILFKDGGQVFSEYIGLYLRGNILGDEFFQLLNKLLDYIGIVELEFRGTKHYVFIVRGSVKVKTHKISVENTGISGGDKVFDILLHTELGALGSDQFKYNNVMLLLKEVKDGFVNMRTHSLVLKDSRNKNELHSYKMGEDLVITVDDQNHRVISVDSQKTIYDLEKAPSGEWMVICPSDPDFVSVPTDDFEYYRVEDQGGGISVIYLYGAYTHVLRDLLGFKPLTWQYKFLVNERRINYVAGVRRGGKTLLSSYRICRFLYRQPSSSKHSLRQPKGLYVITSKDKFKAVLDYLEAQSERIKVLKSLVYIENKDRLVLTNDSLDFSGNKLQSLLSTYDFASSKGYKTGVGSGGDDIIIDEASTVTEDVWLNLAPIVTNEGAGLFCISTIDWKTPKQWFYVNLTSVERGVVANAYAQRVTIDDIDSHIMDDEAKKFSKSTLAHDMPRYLGELYATLPSESSVFSSEGSILMDIPDVVFSEIIISYDPAKRSDFGGVLVSGIYEGILYILEEYQLQGDYSTYQRSVLLDIKKRFVDEGYKVTFIMDGTQAGDVVAEVLGNLVDYKIWYHGTTARAEVDEYGSMKVAKSRLVTITQVLFQTKKIKIHSGLVGLQDEIEAFRKYVNAAGNTKYDAISGKHDDLVNAMILAGFVFGHINGEISHLVNDSNSEHSGIFPGQTRPGHIDILPSTPVRVVKPAALPGYIF